MRYSTTEARQAADGLVGPAQAEWLDRVRQDLDSYRAALTWLLDRGRPAEAADIAWSLFFFWAIQGLRRQYRHLQVDVVIPIPDSSRPSALQLAAGLGVPYREGFVKNRYIGRTFIMPGQAVRARSVRQKLNPMAMEFGGKNVLLVDDSIVRGTTSREIVQMARESGARKVFFASAAPPVRFPNVYGIDMPTRAELIAAHRSEEQVAAEIGADALIYQDLDALKDAVRRCNPKLTSFETSCFDGHYITGDITADYLRSIEIRRDAKRDSGEDEAPQLDLNLAA